MKERKNPIQRIIQETSKYENIFWKDFKKT